MIRQSDKSKLELLESGVLMNTYFDESHIDLAESRWLIQNSMELLDGKPMRLFNDLRSKVSFSREARNYFRDNTPDDSAVAFVINSKLGELAVNFYLKFNAPGYELRVFQDGSEAEAWLVSHIKHDEPQG